MNKYLLEIKTTITTKISYGMSEYQHRQNHFEEPAVQVTFRDNQSFNKQLADLPQESKNRWLYAVNIETNASQCK